MEITIDKKRAFDAVKMQVSLVARDEYTTTGEPNYAHVALTERDNGMLEQMYGLAVSNLAGELGGIYHKELPIVSGDVDKEEISLNTPNFNAGLKRKVDDMVQLYVEYYLTGYWLKTKGVSAGDLFMSNAEAMLSNARRSVYTRSAPEKKYYGAKEGGGV